MPAVKNPLFPVFLKLESLSVLVVGGGIVALEKLTALFENSPGARVKLVATAVSEPVRVFLTENNIPFSERPFEDADTAEVNIAIIAINNKASSETIYRACSAKNILVNVADTPDLCDFYLGAVATKGQLRIAVSTNGKSPTIAKRVKEVLMDALPEEIDDLLANMEKIRNQLAGDFSEKVKKLNQLTAGLGTGPAGDEEIPG